MSEKILEKIRKLISAEKSERTIGNIAAAELFAQKVADLMRVHNLTLTDVDLAAAQNEAIEAEKVNYVLQKIEAWQCHLLQFIAVANGCMSLDHEKGFQIVIGRESDRRVVIEFYNYFERLALELADKDLAAYQEKQKGWYIPDREEHMQEYRKSFLAGFAVTIGERFRRAAEKPEKKWDEFPEENPNALIFIGSKAQDAMQFAFDTFGVDDVRRTEKATNRQGYYSGKETGEKVALTTKRVK